VHTTLPRKFYADPEFYRQELERFYLDRWIAAGRADQIPQAGDYFVRSIADDSVIVTRDSSSEIHAFFNVCRHRGTRICEQPEGHFAERIQCPYHAWTYALDGRLLGAPHMDEAPGFNKTLYPLKPARLGLWEGFIFLNLSDASAERGAYIPLEKWFEPLNGKFCAWNLAALRSAKRIQYDVRANWKLMFQNYSECYHCLGVHPELSKISPYDSAENDLTEGPFLGGFMRIANGKSLTMTGNACALPVGNFGTEAFRFVFYYSIFPNMLLSLHPDYVMVHRLEPQSPDRTLISCDWFFNPEAFTRSDFNPDDAVKFWDMVNRQDWHVCELSQQGISSRAYEPGPYSARESIPAAWDNYYLQQVE